MAVSLIGWRLAMGGAWLCTLTGVAVLSLLPETNLAVAYVPPVWADLVHIPAYALLTMLTILATATRVRMSLSILVAIVLLVSLFGGVIEILQSFTGRTSSVLDVAWNSAGVVLAAWSYRVWTAQRAAVTKNSAAVMGRGERK